MKRISRFIFVLLACITMNSPTASATLVEKTKTAVADGLPRLSLDLIGIVVDYILPGSAVAPKHMGGAIGVLKVKLPNLGESYCFPNSPSAEPRSDGKVNYLCVGRPQEDLGTFEQAELSCANLNKDRNAELVRLLTKDELIFFAKAVAGADYEARGASPNQWYININSSTLSWPPTLGIETTKWYWSSSQLSSVVGSSGAGSTLAGSTALGSSVITSTAVGSTAVGSTAVGSTAVGSTAVDSSVYYLYGYDGNVGYDNRGFPYGSIVCGAVVAW